MECNHFAEKTKDTFRKRNVIESFRFHPTLILLYLKECNFTARLVGWFSPLISNLQSLVSPETSTIYAMDTYRVMSRGSGNNVSMKSPCGPRTVSSVSLVFTSHPFFICTGFIIVVSVVQIFHDPRRILVHFARIYSFGLF